MQLQPIPSTQLSMFENVLWFLDIFSQDTSWWTKDLWEALTAYKRFWSQSTKILMRHISMERVGSWVSRHEVRGRGDICTLFCKLGLSLFPSARVHGKVQVSVNISIMHQSHKLRCLAVACSTFQDKNAFCCKTSERSLNILEDKLKIGLMLWTDYRRW